MIFQQWLLILSKLYYIGKNELQLKGKDAKTAEHNNIYFDTFYFEGAG